ncbi:MAG: GntR family transcriptional regulator [Christensenellales bacterium]|jgi:DNA-binding GntR family transcriptional regulator
MAYVRKKEGSKQEIAYQKIKAAILNNEFMPHTMLLEGELCNMLGFSKTPIREALRRLMSEGFVVFVPEKGTFVSKLSAEEFIQMFEVREALEGMAARLCAIKREQIVIDKLGNILSEMFQDMQEEKRGDIVESDMKFHDVIINGSRNNKLMNFTKTMIQQIHMVASYTVNDKERLDVSYYEHKKVYEAIRDGDPDASEKTMREHIKSVKAYQVSRNDF